MVARGKRRGWGGAEWDRGDTFGAIGVIGGHSPGWGDVEGAELADSVRGFFLGGGLVFAGGGFGLQVGEEVSEGVVFLGWMPIANKEISEKSDHVEFRKRR